MLRALQLLSLSVVLIACGATPPENDAIDAGVFDAGDVDVIEDAGGDAIDIDQDEDPDDQTPDDTDAGAIEAEDPPMVDAGTDVDGPDSSRLTLASWNANYNNTVAAVVAHVRDIDADVIGLQEMGSKPHARDIVDALTCASCAYRAFQPFADNAHACPILWKKDRFELLASGHRRVNEPVTLNDGGSRDVLLAKSTLWVKLREKSTGAKFFFSNNHLVPSVEGADGRPRGSASPIRLEMYRQHMNAIVDTVQRANEAGLPIFITGDFNVNYRTDRVTQAPLFPYARFSAKNVYANWKYLGAAAGQGTHGSRLIDSVHITRAPQRVKPLNQVILGTGGSDHNALRVAVRLYR